MGRDIIAEKDGVVKIIQCKYWSHNKVIHEKHVFQLFGSVVEYRIQNPDSKEHQADLFGKGQDAKRIEAIFVTSTLLSDRAKKVASILNIKVIENKKIENWPMIKCNISQRTGEKIYHLPFDQQYDKVRIEADRGEFYASTVIEAEQAGFRRAWKWKGTHV